MLPELGLFALIIALGIAVVQSAVPLVGAQMNLPNWIAVARPAAYALFAFVGISYAILTYSFIANDFSVAYVAHHSNSLLPLMYRISGVWGGHEGSLLLWMLILAGWSAAVARYSRSIPDEFVARVLAVMGMVAIGFLAFILFTSSPFERLLNVPADGRDLNPLLQDFGLIVHPPMLYFGYVGFSVAFSFAIAALLGRKLDHTWARWARPWTSLAWMFLTIGIALGSWWAYYELGWGGWWFWDPVENASFMPWLVGTALMHSLAATEKRGVFIAWTVLLAVTTFSLSLLGTFLVRSGVLTSVHAFATDPTRGVFILFFLGVVVGGSLLLYAWRASAIRSYVKFDLVSRETGLLINNVLLLAAAGTVLLGTLYPLLLDALNLGKISVGPPYFNSVFLPVTAPLALLLGVGAITRWKRQDPRELLGPLTIPFGVSIIAGFAFPGFVMGSFSWLAAIGMTLAFWIALSTLYAIYERISNRRNKVQALLQTPRHFFGMVLGHLGIGAFIVGITLTSLYSVEKDIGIGKGESHEIAGYTFIFDGVGDHRGPNYTASRGTVKVYQDGREIAVLHPEKRNYKSGGNPMTEAAIDPGLTRDLYVALGEPLGGERWSLRIYYKAYVRWIWLGALIMGAGGIVAATDRRYRYAQAEARKGAAGPAPVPGAA
ncbi:MAG: heme lyase CcmF/NrfE family subunit [Thiotrichales bacterium]